MYIQSGRCVGEGIPWYERKRYLGCSGLIFSDAAGARRRDVEPASSNQVWAFSFTSIYLLAARKKRRIG